MFRESGTNVSEAMRTLISTCHHSSIIYGLYSSNEISKFDQKNERSEEAVNAVFFD